MADTHGMASADLVAKTLMTEHADLLRETVAWVVAQFREAEISAEIGAAPRARAAQAASRPSLISVFIFRPPSDDRERLDARMVAKKSRRVSICRQGAAAHGAGLSAERIEELVALRAQAKKARDFAQADLIREQLAEEGVALEDGPGGTTWRRV